MREGSIRFCVKIKSTQTGPQITLITQMTQMRLVGEEGKRKPQLMWTAQMMEMEDEGPGQSQSI